MSVSPNEIIPSEGYSPSNSDWTSVMEFKLFPPGPISDEQKNKIIDFLDNISETKTKPHTVESDETDRLTVGLTIKAHNEYGADENAFEAAVGALASAGVDLDLIEVSEARVFPTLGIPEGKRSNPISAASLLSPVPIELALDDFRNEVEVYQELQNFKTP